MISVCFYRKGSLLTGFSCEGHALFADPGQDIVCAAVSALVINTANSIEKLTTCRFREEADESGGFIRFYLDDDQKEGQLLLKSLKLGLESVRESAGEAYLKIRLIHS